MGVRENAVETYLNNRVKAIGGITRKWISPGNDGVPDRIVIYKGVVYFIEVKTVDGVLSGMQQREQQRLLKVGAYVATVYGVCEVDQIIDELLRLGGNK